MRALCIRSLMLKRVPWVTTDFIAIERRKTAMNVTVVRDDATPDALENLITSLDGTSSSVIFLSEFILSNGYRYNGENGRFIPTARTDVHAGSLAPPMLLNRVVEISTYSCSRLADEISAPTRGLVSELYSRLLARYPQPYCPEISYSTVGKLVPLFTQWSMVTKGIPGVRVPIFKYGYGPEKISAEDLANPIYKSPFNFYEWRPNDPPEGVTMDTFVVDRPKGEPLLGMMCGRHTA